MTSDFVALTAAILVLFPMAYFLLTSPTFLLVKLSIPEVTQLLRGHFSAYFLMVSIVGGIATVVFAAAGRPFFAIGVGLIAGFAVYARPRFLRRMDHQLSARDSGDADAVRRLRQLHWAGMLCNGIQLAAVVSSIPYVIRT